MKICKNCGAQIADDAMFCDSCGQKFDEELVFCDSCGEKNSPDALFCEKCGHKLIKDEEVRKAPVAAPNAPVHNKEKNEKYFGDKRSKRSAKPLIFTLLALFFLGGGFFLFKNLSGPKSPDNFICYVKDNELIYNDFSKNAPFELANNLGKYAYMGDKVAFSTDGKFIIYGDNLEDNNTFSLYKKSTNFKKDDKEKIDSDVTSFVLTNNDNDLIYFKDGGLYSYNISKAEKDKIDSDVSYTYTIEDNGRVIYITNDNRLYLKELGKEKVKLSNSAADYRYGASNPDNILFSDEDNILYEVTPGGERQKVASDVFSYNQNEDSSYYYFTGDYEAEDNKLFYKTFGGEAILVAKDVSVDGTSFDTDGTALVFTNSNDDFYSKLIDDSESNKTIEEPKAPDYPSYYDYDSDEAYDAAYKKYEAAYREYSDKLETYRSEKFAARNLEYTAENVKNIIDNNVYDLYYFNGKESVKIDTTFNSLYSLVSASTGIISSPKENVGEKVKLSSLVSLDESEILKKIQEEATDCKFIHKGTSKPIGGSLDAEILGSSLFSIGESENIFYFITDNKDLYKIDATASEITPQLYDSDVSASAFALNNGKDLFYVKDVDNKDHGDLYHNKEKVDSDVYAYSISLSSNENRIFYGKDFSSKSFTGALYYFENGKSQKVDDNVYSYSELPDKIYYINDYSSKSSSGDLKVLKGSESELIDTDVSELVFPQTYYYDNADVGGC